VFAFYDPRIPVNVFASPTKLYEAMLMGKAVIMNSEVRLSEKVQDWQIGYSCAYDDIDALVRILQRIVGTPTEADEMGKRARVLFEQNYAWELLVPRLEEAIRTRFAEGGIGGV
jgi:glycosyltransferase involved in cell wall biosynthesis